MIRGKTPATALVLKPIIAFLLIHKNLLSRYHSNSKMNIAYIEPSFVR